jgi:hypothetical protein
MAGIPFDPYIGQNSSEPEFVQFPPQAIVFATDGTYNYYGFAPPGTAQSAAAWQVMRVLIADGTTTAWANGNANYSNVGTPSGLSSLSYS